MKNFINNSINQYRLLHIKRTVRKINEYSRQFETYSDETLQQMTYIFKERINNGEHIDQLLPEAYAVVREASRRILKMYPKEVQLMGAIVLHSGQIAEMQTGEGKTLTATMPLYLNALSGNGAFLITTNDYLAVRDCEEMRPLYEWLGLTVELGFVDEVMHKYRKNEKKEIYHADIIYTTNGRIGFDYLIDNLADSKKGKFMKTLNYAIIDEVDSIILDSARTPLVISGQPRVQSNLFNIVKSYIDTLVIEKDFFIDRKKQEIYLTNDGINKANTYFKLDNIFSEVNSPLVRNINLALRAEYLFEHQTDYFIFNGEIILIDRIGGRLLFGTKMQSGLHQAIEAKEHLEISSDMSVMATITFQNLFKQFNRFSGMTATGKTGEKEFFDLYSKIVIQIPTDQPIQRIDMKDKVFVKGKEKNEAIIKEIEALYQLNRPVLLITKTIEAAELFSEELYKINIPNNLLTAQNAAKEAQMIAEAGQLGAVTVATSMAGRGTDIKLAPEVKDLGGLAVIINEHMDNTRLDKQLRGRAGRQGDPGSSQIYISLEDDLVKKWSDTQLIKNQKLFQMNREEYENSIVFKRKIRNIVQKAQKIAEEQSVVAREMSNEYEKSISIQREIIYKERNNILNASNFDHYQFEKLAENVFNRFINRTEHMTREKLVSFIYTHISFQFEFKEASNYLKNEELLSFLMKLFQEKMVEKKNAFGKETYFNEYLQKTMLKAIDSAWINQVDNLQQLKNSVNNRQNGHRNAIFEYHREALESFNGMTEHIEERIIKNICLSMVTYDKEKNLVIHFP